MKGTKCEKLVIALAIGMEQLNAKDSTATDKGIRTRKILFACTVHWYCFKGSSKTFLF